MTQVNERNMQNFEFQQQQMLMMGVVINQVQEKLPPEIIKQMKKDYVKMYYGFTSINWGMGKTLGISWQKALEQMDSFVATKTKISGHPANNELINFHSEFRRDMSKAIMTNPNTNLKLEERLKKNFLDYGTKSVKESKGALDGLYQKYMPKKTNEKTQTAQGFKLGNQKANQILQQLLIQQQMQRERAA